LWQGMTAEGQAVFEQPVLQYRRIMNTSENPWKTLAVDTRNQIPNHSKTPGLWSERHGRSHGRLLGTLA